jgi:hypothetical protein
MLTRLIAQVFADASTRFAAIMTLTLALTCGIAPATLAPARADGSFAGSCLGAPGALSCVARWNTGTANVRSVAAQDPRDAAESAERERKWVARCKPVIKQDRYGVARYEYAAPGCEFGKSED